MVLVSFEAGSHLSFSRSIEAVAFSNCSQLASGETDLVLRQLFWSFSIMVEEGLASDWER